MTASKAALLTLIVLAWPTQLLAQSKPIVPEETKLRAHITKLASPEFEGRRGGGGLGLPVSR